MPSRISVALILALWLAAAGWFVRREFWVWWVSDGPPPAQFTLADEASKDGKQVNWSLRRGEELIGWLRTTTQYVPEDDSFTLTSELTTKRIITGENGLEQIKEWVPVRLGLFNVDFKIDSLKTGMRVGRDGHMRAFDSQGRMSFRLRGAVVSFKANFKGAVQGGLLDADAEFDIVGFQKVEGSFQGLPVRTGTVFNPLQPVDRLEGIEPGRRWRQPVFDPLAEAFRAVLPKLLGRFAAGKMPLPKAEQRVYRAEVAGGAVPLYEGGEPKYHRIDYYDRDKRVARTWVEAETGKVVRQEATGSGMRLSLWRSSR